MKRRPKVDEPKYSIPKGREALTVQDVEKWFKDAGQRTPFEATLEPIRDKLHYYVFIEGQWRDTADFKKTRKDNALKLRRINDALRTLQEEFPPLIENTLTAFPDKRAGVEAAQRLMVAVNEVAPGFSKFVQPGRGRQRARWHRVAQDIGSLIAAALKSSGVKRPGFGKPTSPGVKVLQSALKFLLVNVSPDAIVEAMKG